MLTEPTTTRSSESNSATLHQTQGDSNLASATLEREDPRSQSRSFQPEGEVPSADRFGVSG